MGIRRSVQVSHSKSTSGWPDGPEVTLKRTHYIPLGGAVTMLFPRAFRPCCPADNSDYVQLRATPGRPHADDRVAGTADGYDVWVAKPVRAVGGFFAMSLDTFVLMFKPPFAWREFLLQSWFVARVSMLADADAGDPVHGACWSSPSTSC